MNEVKLIVELCTEDRARLDTIIKRLGELNTHDCSKCVADVAQLMDKACDAIDKKAKPEPEKPLDDVQLACRKVLEEQAQREANKDAQEAPKNAQEEPEAQTLPDTHETAEEPTQAEESSEASVKAVSTAELQQLVIGLCRAGKKDKVREIVTAYGVPTVASIPESKLPEAYAKLKALEG